MHSPTVSGIWPAIERIERDLYAVASEQGVSEVLLLTTLKDFCERRLSSVIEEGR